MQVLKTLASCINTLPLCTQYMLCSPMAVNICCPDALCRHRQHLSCGGQLRATAAAAQPVKPLEQLQQQPQAVSWAGAHQQQLAGSRLQLTAHKGSLFLLFWFFQQRVL